MVMSIAHHWQERSVKWAKPDNLHVTLRFLGDISLERSKSLGRVLDQIACEESPFELALDSVGAFPTVHRPRILWISLSCVDTGLHLLQNRVERATCDLGWEPEIKSYKPISHWDGYETRLCRFLKIGSSQFQRNSFR